MKKCGICDVIRISVDVMGGDYGPEATIAGAAIVQKHLPNIYFIYGIKKLLPRF